MNARPEFVYLELDDAADLDAAIRRALAPSNPPPAAEWVAENFRLSAKDSAAPGLIALDPWQAEVLRAFDDPRVKVVVLVASSQTGKSVLLLALANFAARHRPGPLLLVNESERAAEAFMRDRVEPSLDINSADILNGARSKGGSKITRKSFTTGSTLNAVGANSPASLSSRPAGTIVATEVRGYPLHLPNNGDPVSMALARLKSFPRGKAFFESSPGVLGRCRLSDEADKGDRRRYHLRCNHCGHEAPVSFEATPGNHWVSYSRKDPRTACIVCIGCGALWSAQDRLDAIRNGYFAPTKAPSEEGYVSFHYSELESPRSTVPSIVSRYIAAEKKPELMQAFQNTVLGLPFDEEQATVHLSDHDLAERAEVFDARVILPDDVFVITAGVDTQVDRLELATMGHGPGNRRRILDYVVFRGDPSGPTVWQELERWLLETRYRHPLGGELRIRAACVDSGGWHTQQVYDWSAEQQKRGRPFYAVKGVPGMKPIIRKSKWSKLRKDDPFRLQLVGVDTAKGEIFAALNADPDTEGGRLILPKHLPASFFEGLTSEKQVLKALKNGGFKFEYVKTDRGTRNEALDVTVYALAGFHMLPMPDWQKLALALAREAEPAAPKETLAEKAARLQRTLGGGG